VDEVIQMILLAFGPGRRVVVPVPSFSEYSERALVAGARVSQVPLTREFDLDVDGIVAGATAAGADPCLIFICNPHNPSGKLFARDAIEAILKDTSAMVIVDEAYAEFAGCTCLNLLPAHERLVVLRTLSKAFGLAGVRVGYAVAREDLAAELSRVRQPFNMDSLSLVIARIAVEDSGYVRDNVSAVLAERSRVFQELAAIPGIAPFPSRANFVLFRTAGFAVRVWERLRSEGIALRRFARDPVLNDCLRVTIGTAAENSAFLDALRGIMERSRPAEDSRPAQNSRFAEDGGVRHA
jgi:histidinol-phosphate aminotransferase